MNSMIWFGKKGAKLNAINKKGMFSRSYYISGMSAYRHFYILENRLFGISEYRHCLMSKKRDYLSNNDRILDLFWNDFYDVLENQHLNKLKETNRGEYHKDVLHKLEIKKSAQPLSDHDLRKLQMEIEDHTMNYTEEGNLFGSTPTLINLLIYDNISAKDYLKQHKNLSNVDLSFLNLFSQYALEAIIIHVLGSVFNCLKELPCVRVATLIDQLDYTVRAHFFIKKKNTKNIDDIKIFDRKNKYSIGVCLIELLIERNVIVLLDPKDFYKKISDKKIVMRSYAMCNFDIKLLPLRLNLPMIYRPINWCTKVKKRPLTLADFTGGYLSGLSVELYNRFRLLTSHDYENFYIEVYDPDNMCRVLNRLQSEVFEINKQQLEYINNNRDLLEAENLLMDRRLANVNCQKACDLLRLYYINKDESFKNQFSFNFLMNEFVKQIQRGRYEEFILKLANAYEGYKFYLPAFVDFRGRIYRAGVLHFHERDLAKSLIQFSNDSKHNNNKTDIDDLNHLKKIILEKKKSNSPLYEIRMLEKEASLRKHLACAAAFKFKKFSTLDESYQWYIDMLHNVGDSDEKLIKLVKLASDPFQFLAKFLSTDRVNNCDRIRGFKRVPVSQDASASAYQLMSYFLLNTELGRQTNLLPSPDGKIQDLYLSLKDGIKEFLRSKFDTDQYAIIESGLSRGLIKRLFMPLIYGKTIMTMSTDIGDVYGKLLNKEDHRMLAKLIYDYFKSKYPDIVNLMKLINLIGWFCSSLDNSVYYRIQFFTTVQDYMRIKSTEISIYKKLFKNETTTKIKRKITLRVPTDERDKRKSKMATCVNFIHQKDAYIAMKVVEKATFETKGKAPIYTVHDNFITTVVNAERIPYIYTEVFMEMGPPLNMINDFIMYNLNNSSMNGIPPGHMTGGYLRNKLISLVSTKKDLNKTKLKTIYDKIEEIVTCYEEYVNTVCGESMDEQDHIKKWNDYKSQLHDWRKLSYNYSLHY